ncbi:MAG: energy-coupling factor transporter ATPase, partial [Treponemataceae bacterium]
MHDPDAIIATRSLTYSYPSSDRPALNHLDLEIRAGEYVAVLGANGSGKSTLLKLIVGLLKPDVGTVRVCENEDSARFRRSIATVLQNPDDQIVATVAEEDVAFGPENLGLAPEEIERRVTSALRAVGLEGSRRKPPHFLSGGERQRLSLAGALAMEAPILALDEAASMLDPAGRDAMLELLDSFIKNGKTILHVTHSMEEASRARRVVVLDHGCLVFDGTPADLFARPELELWGLELPQALVCACALKARGAVFNPSHLDPEGFASDLAIYLKHEPLSEPLVSGIPISVTAQHRHSAPAVSILRFENVAHTYMRGTAFSATAIKGINHSFHRSSSTAIIGPSGSGKSTLLRHGNAVLLPQEGRVLVFGNDTLDPAVKLQPLRMRAALSVQNPEAALFSRYVADDVAYGPKNKGLTGNELVSTVRSAMDQSGLPYAEYRDRDTSSLSGGEKRKAALAGVFALDAELYLLDEPSAALDPASRRLLLERMLRLREKGTSLIATTHSME